MQVGQDNREQILAYVKKHGNAVAKEIVKDLEVSVHTTNHTLNKLTKDGHLNKTYEMRGAFTYAVYTVTDKPFEKITYSSDEIQEVKITEEDIKEREEEERMQKLRDAGVSKVYKLTDVKRPPQPKEGRRKASVGSLQSGIAGFGSW